VEHFLQWFPGNRGSFAGSFSLSLQANMVFSMSCLYQSMSNWLVVLTILKNNKSQWEGLSHILGKIKYVPNHRPVMMLVEGHSFERMINGILPGTMINHQADLSHKRNRSKKYRKKTCMATYSYE
jgi:hypothetical protein